MCASEVDKFSRNDYRSTFFLTFSIDTILCFANDDVYDKTRAVLHRFHDQNYLTLF